MKPCCFFKSKSKDNRCHFRFQPPTAAFSSNPTSYINLSTSTTGSLFVFVYMSTSLWKGLKSKKY